MEQGMDKWKAAKEGANEIYFAVITTSITLAIVFLPNIFLQGFVGRLFREFGIVVYGADLISAFVGDKRKFTQAAIVLINKEAGVHKIGFVTQNDLTSLGVSNMVAVYFPHSYAFSGELMLVPKENVQMLDMPSAEVMKLIVSGGVSVKES
jgi:hypothetical protein